MIKMYNRCTGVYKFGNNTYPRRIRHRSNIGHIFWEKGASYGPGNTVLDYSSSNSPCRMVAVSATGSAVCGEATRFCIETAVRSQKSYKSELHNATAASSQVILYSNPVTYHARSNNS
jgi:hypothetical protein